jgi:hypothetical protein
MPLPTRPAGLKQSSRKIQRIERRNSNLRIPLWQLIRGSMAAPTISSPSLAWRRRVHLCRWANYTNNPAFQLFLMATVEAYNLATGWREGNAPRLHWHSTPEANKNLAPGQMNLLYNAGSIPSALMFAASNEQDLLPCLWPRSWACRFDVGD